MAITLANVTTGDVIRPPRIVVYGGDGVGKTTFAAGAPGPIFIRSENGLGILQVPAFPPTEHFTEVLEAIAALIREEHSYRTLVIDSLDWLEGLVWAYTAREKGVEHLEDIGYGKGYLFAEEHWLRLFKGLDTLREKRGMGVILICHAEIKRFDAPDSAPYDRYQLKLHKRASARTTEWADIVGFAQHETVVRESDVGFNKKVARGVGTGERLLQVTETPAFDAKNRYGLPSPLPLHYKALRDALRAAIAARQVAESAPQAPADSPLPPVAPAEEAA